jgi:hypothetical protein
MVYGGLKVRLIDPIQPPAYKAASICETVFEAQASGQVISNSLPICNGLKRTKR